MADMEKTVKTVLDQLPYGPEKLEWSKEMIRKLRLPEGVRSRELKQDVISIAWPSLLELVLTQLTSMVDQMMVGRLPGQEGIMALSAVGLASQPKFLLMSMIIALNVGATAIIARFRGQQDAKGANQAFRQAIIINLLVSTLFMTVGLIFAEPLVRFMGAGGISPETVAQGAIYLRIQLYGFLPVALTATITAALRGVGDSKTPLVYNTIANVVNVIFNYMLIYGKWGMPRMGIAGASLATVIGQCVAFAVSVYIVCSGKRYLHLRLRGGIDFDKRILQNVAIIGTPSMVEQLFMRAGIILYVRTVAGLGDTLYATHNVLTSILSMSFMIGQAFATSCTTLMGQSLGKRRTDMAALYMKEIRKMGLWVSLVVLVTMGLLREQYIALFNDTPEVIAAGGPIMLLMALMQPIQTDQFIMSGGLRGAGDTRYTAIVTAATVLAFRNSVGMVLVNVLHWGLWGAWIAIAADQCLRSVLMNRRYLSGKWFLTKLQ